MFGKEVNKVLQKKTTNNKTIINYFISPKNIMSCNNLTLLLYIIYRLYNLEKKTKECEEDAIRNINIPH